MRPDSKHERMQRLSTSRARTYLKAHLAWLQGYPKQQESGAINWTCWQPERSPLGSSMRLDRESVRQAEYALNKIEHRVAKELARLVSDPEHWSGRVRDLLNRFKRAIHDAETLPDCLPESMTNLPTKVQKIRIDLLRQVPALRPLADAFSWALFLNPIEFASAVEWMVKHSSSIAGLLTNDASLKPEERICWAMSLWQLAYRHGDTRVEKLIRHLGDPNCHKTPIAHEAYLHYLRRWSKKLSRVGHRHPIDSVPELPTSTIAGQMHDLALWIAGQPSPLQQDALDCFNLIVDETVLGAWFAFAGEAEAAVVEVCRLLNITPRTVSKLEQEPLKAYAKRFSELAGKDLPQLCLNEVLQFLRKLMKPGLQAVRKELLRILPLLPLQSGSLRVREAFFSGTVRRADYDLPSRLAGAIRHFRKYLAGHDAHRSLAPWLAQRRCDFSEVFTLGSEDQSLWPIHYAALRVLVESGTRFLSADLDNVEELVQELRDANAVVSCFRELTAVICDSKVSWGTLRCALQLRQSGADLGQCAVRIEQMDPQTAQPLVRAVESLQAGGQGWIAARLARQDEYGPLVALGRALELFDGLANVQSAMPALPSNDTPPPWAWRYPTELHGALASLATLSTNGEATAERILLKEFPPLAGLKQEIAAIQDLVRERPHDGRLQKRLANLTARVATPSPISPVRLDNLRTQLELAGYRCVIDRWMQQIEADARAKVRSLLGLYEIPDWVWDKSNLRLLAATAKLNDRFRELGLKLFRRRCGPPPWDCHDEPANRQFLTLLRERGVNPDPWLHPPECEWVENRKGRRFRLSFETDPLEVLRMGEPFDTCLSPNGCNFFSTIANAVDLNKRVIYARDCDDRIVVRCLIALTEAGRLLTFRVYTLNSEFDLQPGVSRLVERLAGQMGTSVARKGVVPCLVAPNWYDDGTVDICDRFAFLASGSSFKALLPTIGIAELLPAMQSASAPLPLDDMMIPLFLEMEEFTRRPELILPLIPLLEQARHIPEPTLWHAAQLAHSVGRTDFASRVLNRRVLPRLIQAIRRHGCCPCCSEPVLKTLVEIDPSTALRALRMTRENGIDEDEGEHDARRRAFLAAAHKRLGRTELATRLLDRKRKPRWG